MKNVISILETIPDSSVYGPSADAAYAALKDKSTPVELLSINLEGADTILRNIVATRSSILNNNRAKVSALIAAIPSVARHDNFI